MKDTFCGNPLVKCSYKHTPSWQRSGEGRKTVELTLHLPSKTMEIHSMESGVGDAGRFVSKETFVSLGASELQELKDMLNEHL